MGRFTIAIVGRPNAGKTTLFNRLLRLSAKEDFIPAITDSTPGVTRDRNYGTILIDDKEVDIVDTGGFMPDSNSLDQREINAQVREQAIKAIEEADLVIHLLDAKEGVNASDVEMVEIIRYSSKPFLAVANKVDSNQKEKNILEFYELGIPEVIAVSAITGYNLETLLDRIQKAIPEGYSPQSTTQTKPKIAVIGKPNTGKSTFINTLLGKQRHIVSPIPGTTRDAIDSLVRYYNREYLFIDTAGIRKKSRASQLEIYSMARAKRAIERCDIALLLIDGTEGVTDQDQKIAGLLKDSGKGAIIVVNKWDLVEDPEIAFKKIESQIRQKLWFIDYAPIITLSAMTKKRVTKVFPMIDEILSEMSKRVPTSELNRLLTENRETLRAIEETSRGLKILYMTQVSVAPPHFVLFLNKISSLRKHHLRFFEKLIRDRHSFYGVPLKITLRSSRESDKEYLDKVVAAN